MSSSSSSSVLSAQDQKADRPKRRTWGGAGLVVWIGVIFFSSTSLASRWAEGSYQFLSNVLFNSSNPPDIAGDWMHLVADKGFHVALFCVLAGLLWLALPAYPRKPLWIILCGAGIGSCSEFLQRFFPDRDPALRDVVINTFGTALGVLICVAVRRATGRHMRSRSA